MKKVLIFAAIFAAGFASALTPEEKEAQEKARAEAKASEEAWKTLRKEAEDLAQKDFKGGFADYWHDHLDAARALLDDSLTNAVFKNKERIEIFRQMAQYRLEATRDEQGALAEVERAFALPDLTDDDRALAESRRTDLRRLMGLDPEPEPPVRDEAFHLADLAAQQLGSGAWNRAFDGYARFCAEKEGAAFFRERVPVKFAEALAADAKTPCARTAFDIAAWQVRRGEADPGFKDPAFGEWLLGWIDTLPAENRPDAVRLFEYADSFRGRALDERKEIYAKGVVERAKDGRTASRRARSRTRGSSSSSARRPPAPAARSTPAASGSGSPARRTTRSSSPSSSPTRRANTSRAATRPARAGSGRSARRSCRRASPSPSRARGGATRRTTSAALSSPLSTRRRRRRS